MCSCDLTVYARWEQFINLDRPTALGTTGCSTVEHLHLDQSGDDYTWALPFGDQPQPKNLMQHCHDLGLNWKRNE